VALLLGGTRPQPARTLGTRDVLFTMDNYEHVRDVAARMRQPAPHPADIAASGCS